MKLENKHLAGYLVHSLKMYSVPQHSEYYIEELTGIDNDCIRLDGDVEYYPYDAKPILRPLSDLTKEIDVNGKSFIPCKEMGYNIKWYGWSEYIKNILEQPYKDIQKLYEWHFDIHGLIEKGLAVNINTLKP